MDDELTPDAFLEAYPPHIRTAANRLRAIVREVVPGSLEAARPGWKLLGYRVPVGRRAAYYAFIAPEPIHVHLGFEYGALLDDPGGVLGGTELRQVRFFTFARTDDIRPELVGPFVRQAAHVAALGRAGRLALALDRER